MRLSLESSTTFSTRKRLAALQNAILLCIETASLTQIKGAKFGYLLIIRIEGASTRQGSTWNSLFTISEVNKLRHLVPDEKGSRLP